MTDTIMLEAPARGGRISDLADGQGRILRLHDITASSLGHTSHANPDRKPINVANQTESPTRTGGRVTIERISRSCEPRRRSSRWTTRVHSRAVRPTSRNAV